MKKLICLLGACVLMAQLVHAQVIRPFTARYNNPSVKGNIVYVANSIVSTAGSTGTGEVPPSGTSTDNGGAGIYLDIDNPAVVTKLAFNSTWNYYAAGAAPANDASANTWKQPAYTLTGAAWNTGASGTGAGKYGFNSSQNTCIPNGSVLCSPSAAIAKYTAYYFRNTVSLTATELSTTYSAIRLNMKRDDGIVVYINGVERIRNNMVSASPTPVVYSDLAATDIATGTAEDLTVDLSPSYFTAGTNTIAVEVHTFKAKSSDMSFDMQVQGVPVDNSGTFNSSSADLSLASCSKVLWAGLYWGADQGTSGTDMTWMTGAETSVKLKIPGSSSYVTVNASQTDYHSLANAAVGFNHTGYQAFANITSLLNTTSPNGTYTVANMTGPLGINNACGGWTIVIAYENSSLTPRNLTVFDGNAIIDGGQPALDVSISGFLTPPSGTVSCELGAVVFDGDRGSLDAFQFKQNGAGSFYDLATPAAYALNGTSDAWNSKISYKGSVVTTRSPAFQNTLGYDATIMDLPNTSNAQLGNNQTSATVRFSSPSENYMLQVLTTSVTQYNPEFTLTKTSTDVNGATLVGGDVLRYRIDYNNVGNDISNNSIVIDNIPPGATYKTGTLVINGTSKTDASGDDQAEFSASANRVTFRVGTGASSSAGGQVAAGASGYVQFDVYMPKSCSVTACANPISNSARIDYVGATSLASLYDSSGTTASGCFVLGPVVNTVTGSCYTPKDTILLNQCPSTSVTFPLQQYGGYQFYSAMPFSSATAINPATSYSSSRVIYAYWNGGSCSDTVVIRIFITSCPDIDDDNDGIPDYIEANMPLALGDHDSDGVPNYSDAQYPGFVDNNGDGINDNFDPSADSDNDGIPNFLDTDFPGFVDSNGDGVNDNFDADGDGIPNHLDLDSDNDGIPDVVEAYGVDANGDGVIDNYSDTDNDGLSQNVDGNNTGAVGSGSGLGIKDIDGDGIPNYFDLDSDNDGIPDVREALGTDANNDGIIDSFTDTDGDGFADSVDGDVGNDGVAENSANALLRTGSDANSDGRCDSWPYKNMDKDSKPNPYDLDSDGDGIVDVREAGFTDSNNDGKIDGSLNAKGWSVTVSAMGTLTLTNSELTGPPNVYDIDSDDDGIPDNVEGQATNAYLLPSGIDTDGDGIDNSYDNIVGFGGKGIDPFNMDGDAYPDYIDSDTDGDGMPDIKEGNDFNLNRRPDDVVSLLDVDTDGDGLDDRFDSDNNSAKGTSAYMGNGGTFTGDASPGSRTMVQRSDPAFYDRDWRMVEYVLAVDVVNFKAALQDKKVQLQWTAHNTEPVDRYQVQRSTSGFDFTTVATVASRGSVGTTINYAATDNIQGINAGAIYYRLIIIAADGKKKMTPIVKLVLKNEPGFTVKVMPLPVRSNAKLNIESTTSGKASFYVLDMQGKVVSQFTQVIQKGDNVFAAAELTRLPDGVYNLAMSLNGETARCRVDVIH